MHTSVKRLDVTSSAGNRCSSQDLDYWAIRDRNRRQKSQESYLALEGIVGAAERFQERLRQGGNLDSRQQTTARDFPERCPRNVVAPELLRSSNRGVTLATPEPLWSVGQSWPRRRGHEEQRKGESTGSSRSFTRDSSSTNQPIIGRPRRPTRRPPRTSRGDSGTHCVEGAADLRAE